tara:strand:- start:1371 stop:1529 length:159 start_codon:yes stop_codon:yes gene_type:complete
MNLKLGDKLAFVFKWTGIKWLTNVIVVELLGYNSCGCEERQESLNNFTIKRK